MTRQDFARLKLRAFTLGKDVAILNGKSPAGLDGTLAELDEFVNALYEGYQEGQRKAEADKRYGRLNAAPGRAV